MTATSEDSEARLKQAIVKVSLPEQAALRDLAIPLAAASIDCGKSFKGGVRSKGEEEDAREVLWAIK